MAYRPEWFAKISGGRSILEIALDVHMGVTGSSERSRDDQVKDAQCLIYATQYWEESQPFAKKFDDAVRAVIEAAIEEHRNNLVNPVGFSQ